MRSVRDADPTRPRTRGEATARDPGSSSAAPTPRGSASRHCRWCGTVTPPGHGAGPACPQASASAAGGTEEDTGIPGARIQGAPRAPRRLAGLRNRCQGPKSSEHQIADSGPEARPSRPSSRAYERVTLAPSQEHLPSLTGLWSQETGPRPRAAYMMYTFSAWEKWKVSLVRGQTTLSSWRMDSRDWKIRLGVTAKAAQSAAPAGRAHPERLGTEPPPRRSCCQGPWQPPRPARRPPTRGLTL